MMPTRFCWFGWAAGVALSHLLFAIVLAMQWDLIISMLISVGALTIASAAFFVIVHLGGLCEFWR